MNQTLPVQLVPVPKPGPLVAAPATVTVFGAGRSGLAAAHLLLDHGYKVRISDSGSDAKLEAACRPLAERGAAVSLGEQSARFAAGSEFIVISPGIDERGELFASPELKGIPVFGEVEIAFWYCPIPMLAVTGTNGKSTTVSLLGRMLLEAGIKNKVAGNIGKALCDAVRNLTDEAVIVAEISSFQLHTVESFHPRVGLLLNLSPDHLERYDTREQYYRSKFRMFERMGAGDLAVLNADDPEVAERTALAGEVPLAWFSLKPGAPGLAFTYGSKLIIRTPGGSAVDVIDVKDIRLKGRHNLANTLAAASVAAACGASPEAIGRACRDFGGLPHRLEPTGESNGVSWCNDSKATTVDSVLVALQSFAGPLVVIMGGRHKGAPFTPLADELASKARLVIALGEAAAIIEDDLGKVVRVSRAGSLADAIGQAARVARAGDTVLLSPGCSSFDMFDNYEHRGAEFKRLVTELTHGA